MFELVPWDHVNPEWCTRRDIRLLGRRGKCPVLDELVELKMRHPEDFAKLLAAVKGLVSVEDFRNPRHVKKSANRKHSEIYELKGGQIRLFFFFSAAREIVVLLEQLLEGQAEYCGTKRRVRKMRPVEGAIFGLIPIVEYQE